MRTTSSIRGGKRRTPRGRRGVWCVENEMRGGRGKLGQVHSILGSGLVLPWIKETQVGITPPTPTPYGVVVSREMEVYQVQT